MKRVSHGKRRRSQAISRRCHHFSVGNLRTKRRSAGGVRRPWADTTLLRQAFELDEQHLQLQPPLRPGNAIPPVAAHAQAAQHEPEGQGQQAERHPHPSSSFQTKSRRGYAARCAGGQTWVR